MGNTLSHHFPSQALPIDSQELADALTLISRVFSGEDNFDPTRYRMNVLNENGEIEQKPMGDSLMNRIMLALQEWCHEEPVEKYLSLCWRLFALNELIHQGVLDEWVRKDGSLEFITIPGAVIQVASVHPLDHGKGFSPQSFIEAVKKILY